MSVDNLESKASLDGELCSRLGMIVFVRGLPGSGKTSLSLRVRDNFLPEQVEHIDPDLIDKSSSDYAGFCEDLRVTYPDLDPCVYLYRYLLKRAKDSLAQGKLVLWSQPFSNTANFSYTVSQFKNSEPSSTAILIVDVLVDKEVARNQMKKRKESGGHGPDDEYFDKLVNQFETADKWGYNYLCIEMGVGFDEPLKKILEKVGEYV